MINASSPDCRPHVRDQHRRPYAAGHEVWLVEDFASLERALHHGETGLVILDLHAGVGQAPPSCSPCSRSPVLAFGRHTEAALLRSARECGCVEVVALHLVEELPALVTRNARD
jgi:hypothetical protein